MKRWGGDKDSRSSAALPLCVPRHLLWVVSVGGGQRSTPLPRSIGMLTQHSQIPYPPGKAAWERLCERRSANGGSTGRPA